MSCLGEMSENLSLHRSSDVQDEARRLYRGELLAPMVRASTTPLRTLSLRYGADAVYTEEMVDRSIVATTRIENEELRTIDYVRDTSQASAKTMRRLNREGGPPLLLRIDPKLERGKLICQIGSGEPELALPAALHIHKDADGLDINMGCPKKFSVSGGMGSALLSDPDRACRILRTLKDHLPHKPVSAKIRLLSDNKKTMDFITGLVERGGANAVAIHGRTVGLDAVDPANWSRLEEIVILAKAKFPHIPFLINGDFYTRQEFLQFQQRSGADGVLLARPALYNTSIFCKPSTSLMSTENQPSYGYDSPLLLDKTLVIKDYIREAVRYDIHYKNVKYVVCEMMNNRRAPSIRAPFLPQEFPGQQTIGKTCACQSVEEICRVWNLDYSSLTAQVMSSISHASAPTSPTQTTTILGGRLRSQTRCQAPAGEHKYEDEYILKSMTSEVTLDDRDSKVDALFNTAPPTKRTRVES